VKSHRPRSRSRRQANPHRSRPGAVGVRQGQSSDRPERIQHPAETP